MISKRQRSANARAKAYKGMKGRPSNMRYRGHLGGLATTRNLTPAQLSERGRKGAMARWHSNQPDKADEIEKAEAIDPDSDLVI